MRLIVTADLHYDIARSRPATIKLAENVVRNYGDNANNALVLLGDVAGADLKWLHEGLRLFDEFRGKKFFVPGNHCLWCVGEESSLDRYDRTIPATAAEAGFVMLDHAPAVLGRVGLVGSIGWYDYSFADESLGIPEPFYRAKLAPGAANYYVEHRDLIEAHRNELTDEHLEIGARWMDGVHVRLGMSDAQFVHLLADKLTRQIEELSPKVDRIVAFLHHLPFVDLVPMGRPPRFAFAAAYMGAVEIGRVLLAAEKVTHVYCGHSHWPIRRTIGHIEAINVGSTYTDKRLEILEL